MILSDRISRQVILFYFIGYLMKSIALIKIGVEAVTNAEVKEVMATKMSAVHPLHVGITGIIGIGVHPGVKKRKLSFPRTKMTKILKDPSLMIVPNLTLILSPRTRMQLSKNAAEKGKNCWTK